MKAKRLRSMRLFLILIVTMTLVVGPVRADDPSARFSPDFAGPIGAVHSSGAVAINGRLFQGEQAVWKGDLLQTSESSARLTLDSIGEVRLDSKTEARISTTLADADSRRALIASVISGTVTVTLEAEAAAHIEAGGMTFTTSPGSSFRVWMSEGCPVIDSVKGSVTVEAQEIEEVVNTSFSKVEPVPTRSGSKPSPAPVQVGLKEFKVEKGSTTRLLWKVTRERKSGRRGLLYVSDTQSLSDPVSVIQKPAVKRKVQFRMSPDRGRFNQVERETDENGMVEVEFTALKKGHTTISAIVSEYNSNKEEVKGDEVNIEVLSLGIPTWKKLVVLGSIGAGIIIWRWVDDGRGPLRKQDPPVIFPPR